MIALGEEIGELNLSVPKCNLGLRTLIRTSSEECNNYIVEVTTLSAFASGVKLQKINFLKIDVEGFEHQVLLGAESVFKNSPPDYIMFELNNFEGRAKDQPVIEYLKVYNYKFISVPKCLCRMYTAEFDEQKGTFELGNDVIAVQPHAYPKALEVLRTRL